MIIKKEKISIDLELQRKTTKKIHYYENRTYFRGRRGSETIPKEN